MRKRSRPPPSTTAKWALGVAIVSGLISLLQLWYVFKTYEPTHRAFLGVDVHSVSIDNLDNPHTIRWVLTIKNVGSVPAKITDINNQGTVTLGQRAETIPRRELPGRREAFLRPGLLFAMQGNYTDTDPSWVPVAKLLDGSAKLELLCQFTYENPGLFRSTTHHLSTLLRFDPYYPKEPTFAVVEESAD